MTKRMKRVVVITTDGAIGTRSNPMVAGTVSSIKGEEFLSLLPRESIDLAFEEFSNLPSSHIMPVRGLELAQRVESALLAPDVDGVVITHGTDTLEETAYLLDLTLNSPKPVVFTGSMRMVSRTGYDGVTNLSNAIRVAAASEAREMGTLIVLGDDIHAASEAQLVHTQAINAIQSPGSGPLGHVESKHIWLHHRPLRRQYIPCARLEETVDLICLVQGGDDRMLRHSMADGVTGVVLEAFGSGRVPPWWLPAITEAIAQRIVVAVTSRCQSGGLGDDYGYVGAYHDLRRLGVLLVHNLNGPKARIKLMVALGAARSTEELRGWFR